ncbi:MAG: hypothetical protein WA581_17985 [Candidatus Acidiferrales bacterium]
MDFLKLRADRVKVARTRKGVQKKSLVAVPPMNPPPAVGVTGESQEA